MKRTKGFAVVADEIRNLADNSKNTANHIQGISIEVIDSVSELSENAEKLLNLVNTRIRKDYDTLEETGKQYYDAAETVEKIMTQFMETTQCLLSVMERVTDTNEGISATVMQSKDAITNVVGNTEALTEEMEQVITASSGVNLVTERLLEEVKSYGG